MNLWVCSSNSTRPMILWCPSVGPIWATSLHKNQGLLHNRLLGRNNFLVFKTSIICSYMFLFNMFFKFKWGCVCTQIYKHCILKWYPMHYVQVSFLATHLEIHQNIPKRSKTHSHYKITPHPFLRDGQASLAVKSSTERSLINLATMPQKCLGKTLISIYICFSVWWSVTCHSWNKCGQIIQVIPKRSNQNGILKQMVHDRSLNRRIMR